MVVFLAGWQANLLALRLAGCLSRWFAGLMVFLPGCLACGICCLAPGLLHFCQAGWLAGWPAGWLGLLDGFARWSCRLSLISGLAALLGWLCWLSLLSGCLGLLAIKLDLLADWLAGWLSDCAYWLAG
jgi:hypothetical protein